MEDLTNYLKLINNCDPNDPLLSSTYLGECLSRIPIDCVNPLALKDQTLALNLEQLIPTDGGLARDYRGLGELLGFSRVEVETRFKNSSNPTRSMIDAFINKNINNDRNCRFSLNDLLKLLEKIERFDVIDDLLPRLVELASSVTKSTRYQLQPDFTDNRCVVPKIESGTKQDLVRDKDRLTINDTVLATMQYDAFICFAPEDYHYAKELVDSLEDNGKSIATADDLLPGHFEHDALIRLIDSRCRKVIVVLTPNFSRSKECEFQTKFASEIGIRSDCPKIIPVMYEACDDSALPLMIQAMTKIDMTSRGGNNRSWQLRRLIRSLDQGSQINNLQEARIPVKSSSSNVENSTNSPPAITYLNHSQASFANSHEPIVDLLQSESSTSFNDGSQNTLSSGIGRSLSPVSYSSSHSNKLIKSIQSNLRKFILGSSSADRDSSSPSTSSQAMLLTTTLSDYSADRLDDDKSA